jgi:hypothetical protein
MKYIKKFESMHREKCDRCKEPIGSGQSTIMSMFNDEVICEKCKEKEKEDPDYKLAEWRDMYDHYTKLANDLANDSEDNYELAAYYKNIANDYYKKIYN